MGLALGCICGRSPDGLEAYKECSRDFTAKFDARECEKVYMSADAGRDSSVCVGSLYYWAAADSPREFQAVVAARRPSQAPESEFPFIHTGGGPSEPAMADMVRMLKNHCPAPPPRLKDLKACKAFIEWLKTKG
jgi:hypothetical protein